MKYTKLFEHGTGKTIIVNPARLAEMQQAPTFNRVYRNDGEASEEDLATHPEREEDGSVTVSSAEVAKPTGEALPAANAGKTDTQAANQPSGAQGGGKDQKKP